MLTLLVFKIAIMRLQDWIEIIGILIMRLFGLSVFTMLVFDFLFMMNQDNYVVMLCFQYSIYSMFATIAGLILIVHCAVASGGSDYVIGNDIIEVA